MTFLGWKTFRPDVTCCFWLQTLLQALSSKLGDESCVGRSMEEPMSTGNRLNSLTSGASSNRELCKISLQDHSTVAINIRIRKCGGGDLQKSLFKYSLYNQFSYKEASLAYRQQACCKCVGVCSVGLHSYQISQVKQS